MLVSDQKTGRYLYNATLMRRTAAGALDAAAILFIYMFVAAVLVYLAWNGQPIDVPEVTPVPIPIATLFALCGLLDILLLVYLSLEAIFGFSPGKRIMSLVIRDGAGAAVTPSQKLRRFMLKNLWALALCGIVNPVILIVGLDAGTKLQITVVILAVVITPYVAISYINQKFPHDSKSSTTVWRWGQPHERGFPVHPVHL